MCESEREREETDKNNDDENLKNKKPRAPLPELCREAASLSFRGGTSSCARSNPTAREGAAAKRRFWFFFFFLGGGGGGESGRRGKSFVVVAVARERKALPGAIRRRPRSPSLHRDPPRHFERGGFSRKSGRGEEPREGQGGGRREGREEEERKKKRKKETRNVDFSRRKEKKNVDHLFFHEKTQKQKLRANHRPPPPSSAKGPRSGRCCGPSARATCISRS